MTVQNTAQAPLLPAERKRLMLQLIEVVRGTGKYVLRLKPDRIHDTVQESGHQFSTVDDEAAGVMLRLIAAEMRDFSGGVVEESKIPGGIIDVAKLQFPCVVCDAVEGSTNAKRGLSATVRRPIFAGTSAVILERPSLDSVVASAFYDFASGLILSSVRTEYGCFESFVDGKVLADENVLNMRGDSQDYVVVPEYSHDNLAAREEVVRALSEQGFHTIGGTRSSAQDLVNMLSNQVDAYVDLRAMFPAPKGHRDEVLHFWDVGALLPVLEGFGFTICDARRQGWMTHKCGERMVLVVARETLWDRVWSAVERVSFVSTSDAEPSIHRLPATHLGGSI